MLLVTRKMNWIRIVIITTLYQVFTGVAAAQQGQQSAAPEQKKNQATSGILPRGWDTWLRGRNRNGNALFSIIVKAGSPLSPTASYGLSIEYRKEDRMPLEVAVGSYSRPKTIGTTDSTSIQTYGAGAGVLAGDKNSYLYFGSYVSLFSVKSDSDSSTFFCIIPTVGIRIESDAELILLLLVSKNISLNGNISAALGDAPSDIGIFKNGGTQISLGFGLGI